MNTHKKSWFKQHINSDNFYYAIKISISIVLSILIAEFLHIDFAPSTGVVALLSMESTKRDSLITARHRIISFLYTVLIAYLVHDWVGTDTLAFALAILLIVILSIFLGWFHTLSVNTVIAVHLFVMSEPFTWHLVGNETARVCIGMVVALLVNWYMPNRSKRNLKTADIIVDRISDILIAYSKILRQEQPLDSALPLLEELELLVEEGSADARNYYNNLFADHARFFIDYMNMRKTEITLLRHIYQELLQMGQFPCNDMAKALANMMEEMAPTISLNCSLKVWSDLYHKTSGIFNNEPLPQSRASFHLQSAAHYILRDLNEMILLKRNFVANLTDEQKKRYLV